jgi:very-short-patch-repair endonuclease
VFTWAQARDLGISDSTLSRWLQNGRLEWAGPKVLRSGGSTATLKSKAMAVHLWAGLATSWISHRTAATLLGIADFGALDVTTTRNLRSRGRVRVFHVSHMPDCDVTEVDGFAITTASRTLIDLGACTSHTTVERGLERALHLGLTSTAHLHWRLAEVGGRGRRGCATLRAVLAKRPDHARPTQSDFETDMWALLEGAGLTMFERQFNVFVGGEFIGRVDFAFAEARIIIEAESVAWHSSPSQIQRDMRRFNRLVTAGWIVLRFSWDDLHLRPSYVIAEVRKALSRFAPSQARPHEI